MKKIKNKSKKFKTNEPEIPFTFDFYLIYWEDIQSDSGWRPLKDIQESKPAICVSTGWLVRKDAKVHVVMSDYNYDDKRILSKNPHEYIDKLLYFNDTNNLRMNINYA